MIDCYVMLAMAELCILYTFLYTLGCRRQGGAVHLV